ncbi:MAG TPA: amidohydrolase [Brevundimonas sp.]|jgi:amidohydrolase|uniref:amidohydrolase n=1 Tax=Brevundimonas sp. TaxID=1871086 RepID=UPI002DEF393E|nr:amidohydrolase [Brevundimonas sp.]
MIRTLAFAAALLAAVPAQAQIRAPDAAVAAVMPDVVAWRRDFHANPELGFAEHRTAAAVAAHLRSLGLEVHENVGRTGVIGVLRGGRPGKTVALRADMDALPVQEATGLPFASTATGTYMGNVVPVAHACGHDAHVAMLMGAAEVLAGMKDQIGGTIVFIFQAAEEGAPPGEPLGGAALMVQEGVLERFGVDAVFGLHVVPGEPGAVWWRPEGFMAASDRVDIVLKGRQTHGAWPWKGVDVIAASAAVVQTVNTLTSRTVDPTTTPTVFTIATLDAGVRYNIIPDQAVMSGTLRTFDVDQRDDLVARAEAAIGHVAQAHGATAEFSIRQNAALVYNDPELSGWLAPVLETVSPGKVNPAAPPTTVAEDFSYFQQKVPGVFFHLGASADGVDPAASPPNHSPQFDVNERVLETGVRAHVTIALSFLAD